MRRLLPLLFLCCLSSPAFAVKDDAAKDGAKLDGMTYAPEYCEFSASFPEQAYKSRRCDDKDQKNCYDLVSFTKVFDLSATVRVDIICNPSSEKIYEQMTLEAMETTVRAMTKGSVIEAYDVSSRQDSAYRQAGLLGKGRSGVHDSMYIAQLWSGKKSMMSVEAQLIGAPLDAADALFAEILRSIGPLASAPEEEDQTQNSEEEELTKKVIKKKINAENKP